MSLIPLSQIKPMVSLSEIHSLDQQLTEAAALELRKSPHLLSYLQKSHLIALAEVGKIKVIGVDESDVKARLSRALTRVEVLEAILDIPHTIPQTE